MGSRTRKRIIDILVYFVLICGGIGFLLPLIWMVRSAFMSNAQIFQMPPVWIPNPIRIANFKDAVNAIPFIQYFGNSLFIVFMVTTGTILTSSICAFSFSRLRWPGRNKVFALVMTSLMLPYYVTLIPTFLGWHAVVGGNSYLPLIVPAWFGGGAFNIFLTRQIMMGIPKELDEAAIVDGAGYFRIFANIILPLSKSAMIVVGLFTFLNTWNDFMGPLIYLNEQSRYTLALGLQMFIGMYSAQWNLLMAASAIVALPPLIVFLIGQKYIIEGIAMTAVKG